MIDERGRVQKSPYRERSVANLLLQSLLAIVAQKSPKQLGVGVLGQFHLKQNQWPIDYLLLTKVENKKM